MAVYRRATYTGQDNILSAFDTMYEDEFCYSVWAGESHICFQHPFADHERGKQTFAENISALDQAKNDDLFILKFHPLVKAKTYIEKKTPVISETPFRVTELGEGVVNGVGEPNPAHGNMSYRMFEAVEAIKKLPETMNERQQAFEDKILLLLENEPVEPQQEPAEKYIQMAIGALREPNVMNNVVGLIKMFIPSFNPPAMNQNQISGPTISGTNDTPVQMEVDIQKLDAALLRLSKHCKLDDDLTKLADIAENNPAYFKMLLTGLRA